MGSNLGLLAPQATVLATWPLLFKAMRFDIGILSEFARSLITQQVMAVVFIQKATAFGIELFLCVA